ncbi:tetratricopeptide repeat protein 28-like [Orbicella faveolata]|uniref:tetratricopeptide repeat protein 28-like n=1 Tax=Orbicella faveolata TaxID=48498 RepID=UPI0009E3341E|nr:tetratricopeptide repeat protein 28-like [Orbicella faveolata]
MNNRGVIRLAVSIGLVITLFLLNTCRATKAIELCKECLYILNNKAVIRSEVSHTFYNHISHFIMFVAYCLINDYTSAINYGRTLLVILYNSGEKALESKLSLELAKLHHRQCKHSEAKKLCRKALAIYTEIGQREGEASCYESLGTVFLSLGEYIKATENLERALEIREKIGDRIGQASCYGNLGSAFHFRSEYRKAEEYTEKALVIKRESGDRRGEAACYGQLGKVYLSLGEYCKSEEYVKEALQIRREIGDRSGEAADYSMLGTVFQSLGEYVKAQDYHEKALKISQAIGDRNGAAGCYRNLGAGFIHLGEYVKANRYLENALTIEKEIGDRNGEATSSLNLGNVFLSLGKYEEAKDCFENALTIAKEIGCRKIEESSNGSLGNVFSSIGDFVKAKEYQEKALLLSKEIGSRDGEAAAYGNLGNVFLSLGEYAQAEYCLQKALAVSQEIADVQNQFACLCKLTQVKFLEQNNEEALLYLLSSIHKCEKLRLFLGDNDHFKIHFSDEHRFPYWMLSQMLCAAGIPQEALYIAELGRARALADLMSAQYSVENQISADPQSWVRLDRIVKKESTSTFLYLSHSSQGMRLWVLKGSGEKHFREIKASDDTFHRGLFRNLDDFFAQSFRRFDVLPKVGCEDRSLNGNRVPSKSFQEGKLASFRIVVEEKEENQNLEQSLFLCYKMIIAPVADLLEEPEIIIVPDRSLYNVPFAALPAKRGKYLSETHRIRIIPSLTTLKLIQDSPADYHSQTGALIVGDPDVGLVRYKGRKESISRLPCAGKEAEMIGRLLGVQPLLGDQATKQAVLERINSVSLIHFAAHGDAERGEIALSPLRPTNRTPKEEEYLLTMFDISRVQLRAKLVVLSCCHSGQGQIRVEGVVGIARAFLGSGARSVLVALWALEDSATEQFMSRFYEHLVHGESASESLHQAMKWMRANGYSNVRQWAPFMLIGDDVKFDFGK